MDAASILELEPSRKGVYHAWRDFCFCPNCVSGCRGGECCWMLNPARQAGKAWSLRLEPLVVLEGLLPLRRKQQQPSWCQLRWKLWALRLKPLRPRQAPPWGLDKDSSVCVLPPVSCIPSLAYIWERIQIGSPEGLGSPHSSPPPF